MNVSLRHSHSRCRLFFPCLSLPLSPSLWLSFVRFFSYFLSLSLSVFHILPVYSSNKQAARTTSHVLQIHTSFFCLEILYLVELLLLLPSSTSLNSCTSLLPAVRGQLSLFFCLLGLFAKLPPIVSCLTQPQLPPADHADWAYTERIRRAGFTCSVPTS